MSPPLSGSCLLKIFKYANQLRSGSVLVKELTNVVRNRQVVEVGLEILYRVVQHDIVERLQLITDLDVRLQVRQQRDGHILPRAL